jgi:hypothetical protein
MPFCTRTASLVSGIALCVLPLAHQQPILAETFDALCYEDEKCKVVISETSISIGQKSIQSDRILKWAEIEAKSKRKPELCLLSLTACALTIFHDYRYYVEYADANGQTAREDFRFINDKPAKQVARAMTELTNLASGQSNEATQQWASARREEVEYQKMIESLNCSPVLKPYKCSYAAYLDSNPGAKQWAAANPSLVKNQMIQMKAVEAIDKPE